MTETRNVTLYQGDPKLFLGNNGSRVVWRGGQPIMDAGLENMVFILLLTRLEPASSPRGWVGNYLWPNPKNWIGCRFLASLEVPITVASLNNARSEAERGLERLITWGLVSKISVEINNPVGQVIETTIRIEPPGLPPKKLLLIKNGVNWVYQRADPAHGRFENA